MPKIKLTRKNRGKRKFRKGMKHIPSLFSFFEEFTETVRREENLKKEIAKALIGEEN